ncbi:hypothetical protein [Geothrix sp. PMB-07]|uniref:hypothetical protein n=1 Tax=Geothrix sp. PMB-07 TaxID=3068640 RepID=UPI0027428356|nr:hypothetical protein [Geothrix sp. PMB-07]WLT33269.1 hypothetical protein Q9293_08015 [Geothrix sp. PMB-07]
MSSPSLANPLLAITLCFLTLHCGRKGDPIPRPRAAAQAMEVRLEGLRQLRMVLPTADVKGEGLSGVELVRVLYLPLGLAKPTPEEVFSRGEVLLERHRPDLPGPGGVLLMDLKNLQRSSGWLVVVAVRLGNVPGRPSEVLPWMAPAF